MDPPPGTTNRRTKDQNLKRVTQVNHRRDNDVTILPGHLGDQAEVQQASQRHSSGDIQAVYPPTYNKTGKTMGKPWENHGKTMGKRLNDLYSKCCGKTYLHLLTGRSMDPVCMENDY
jgi:hypothetical protein